LRHSRGGQKECQGKQGRKPCPPCIFFVFLLFEVSARKMAAAANHHYLLTGTWVPLTCLEGKDKLAGEASAAPR